MGRESWSATTVIDHCAAVVNGEETVEVAKRFGVRQCLGALSRVRGSEKRQDTGALQNASRLR